MRTNHDHHCVQDRSVPANPFLCQGWLCVLRLLVAFRKRGREEPAGVNPFAESGEKHRGANQDDTGEIHADLHEDLWSHEKEEEKRGVEALQEVVHRPQRRFEDLANGVKSVRALSWDGKNGYSVDAEPVKQFRSLPIEF